MKQRERVAVLEMWVKNIVWIGAFLWITLWIARGMLG